MMNKENKIVPELRFPEFLNKGEWTAAELGKIADNLDFKRIPITSSVREKGNIPYYGASGIIDYVKDYIFDDELLCISEDGANLVDRTYPIAFTIKGKTWVNNHAHVLKFENKNIQVLVEKYLNTINLEKYITGAAQPKLNQAKLAIITIPLSNIPTEQQKIALCLSSLDELINVHTQKLDALKDHKKGLMQQLFPEEGETVPKIRFKEFEKDGEWVRKKLGDIAELTSSKRVHLADYVQNGIPFYRGKEISQLKNDQIIEDLLYISESHYDSIREKYGVPKIGDVLITAVGTLANVYCVKDNERFYFKDGNLIWMRNITIDSSFLEVLLDVEKEKILASAIGSSQKALTMAALNKLEFSIPENPNEQQKIANFLSSIDGEIAAQVQKIEALKEHKRGLMQGLFPQMSEL